MICRRKKRLTDVHEIIIIMQMLAWLDGLEGSVYICKCSIHLVLQTYSEHMNPRMKRLLHAIYYHQTKSFLFPSLLSAFWNQIEKIANELTISHFICDEDDIIAPRLTHIVYHNIRPSRGEKFFITFFFVAVNLWQKQTYGMQVQFKGYFRMPSYCHPVSLIKAPSKHITLILYWQLG